jgi:hypothetical protein
VTSRLGTGKTTTFFTVKFVTGYPRISSALSAPTGSCQFFPFFANHSLGCFTERVNLSGGLCTRGSPTSSLATSSQTWPSQPQVNHSYQTSKQAMSFFLPHWLLVFFFRSIYRTAMAIYCQRLSIECSFVGRN